MSWLRRAIVVDQLPSIPLIYSALLSITLTMLNISLYADNAEHQPQCDLKLQSKSACEDRKR